MGTFFGRKTAIAMAALLLTAGLASADDTVRLVGRPNDEGEKIERLDLRADNDADTVPVWCRKRWGCGFYAGGCGYRSYSFGMSYYSPPCVSYYSVPSYSYSYAVPSYSYSYAAPVYNYSYAAPSYSYVAPSVSYGCFNPIAGTVATAAPVQTLQLAKPATMPRINNDVDVPRSTRIPANQLQPPTPIPSGTSFRNDSGPNNNTFRYDGGPANPIPLPSNTPKAEPKPTEPAQPLERNVSLPASKKPTYRAYGEPLEPRRDNTITVRGQK